MIRLALLLILSPLTIQSCLHHQRRNKIRSVHLYLERKLKILVKDQSFLLLGLWRNCLRRVPQCLPKGMYVTVTHQKITFQHLRLPVVKDSNLSRLILPGCWHLCYFCVQVYFSVFTCWYARPNRIIVLQGKEAINEKISHIEVLLVPFLKELELKICYKCRGRIRKYLWSIRAFLSIFC